MKFRIQRRAKPHKKPPGDDFKLAKRFGELIQKELQDFVKAIVLFGSSVRQEESIYEKDIDILLVVDDLTMVLSNEVIETYRVITEKTASTVSRRLHITTMRLTNFWDYLRNGDPIAINILRDGYPLYDTGFFEPAQQLLFDGRIKPTRESVYAYFARAPLTLSNAQWHILQAATDLYWAVIDAAHAVLMKHGQVPPTPGHAAELLQKTLVSKGLLHKKYVKTMQNFFDLNKDIIHRKIQKLTGAQYDSYRIKAKEFVKEMQRILK